MYRNIREKTDTKTVGSRQYGEGESRWSTYWRLQWLEKTNGVGNLQKYARLIDGG